MNHYTDATIAILGGGQLGRMLIQAGINLNINPLILDPDVNAPCRDLATEFHSGALTDFDTVYKFGKKAPLVTIEIENVNTEALEKLEEEGVAVYPQPNIISTIQDKGLQKLFYKKHGIPTAEFSLLESQEELHDFEEFFPAVQKLRREGYDGRGVQVIQSVYDITRGFDKPSVLEAFIDFKKELSVIVARSVTGEVRTFPAVELEFHPEQNLVEFLFCPADISKKIEKEAADIAIQVAEELGIVGLLAVEMFLTKDDKIVVNEVAPRVHNSGHHTIEGNVTSQFEQHLRAIMGLPLGATDVKIPSVMVNLLGEDGYEGRAKYEGMDDVLAMDGVTVHLYGKKQTRPFRKMGHVTITDPDLGRAREKAREVKRTLKVIA